MRRRPLAEDPSRPPVELLGYRWSDWGAPELDPPRPAWHTSAGMWSAIHAFRRYMNAKAGWEAEHGKIQSGFGYPPGWHELPADLNHSHGHTT